MVIITRSKSSGENISITAEVGIPFDENETDKAHGIGKPFLDK